MDLIPKEQTLHTDKHFILLGFMFLTGESFLCLINIAGIKPMYKRDTGIDIGATHIYNP